MRHFCTYFDQNYLPRGLVLYRSLQQHCQRFQLWVLCMDDVCYQVLCEMELPGVYPIALDELEDGDEPLLAAKKNRSRVEYYFTCSPSLPLFILRRWSEVQMITYLDADLCFFSDLSPVYEEIAQHSVALIAHRFPPALQHLEEHGVYNVGWLTFRRDEHGLACLNWWRERCNEWCYDRVEEKRFGDQKYLDEWPDRFDNVVVIQHKGTNVAPWNLANYELNKVGGELFVDEQPLIFYHFHGLKQLRSRLYDPSFITHYVSPSRTTRRVLYGSYIGMLSDATELVSKRFEQIPSLRSIRGKSAQIVTSSPSGSLLRSIARRIKGRLVLYRNILQGSYLLTMRGRVL